METHNYPVSAFYKLLLSEFIPDDKVIYLDGDTLVLRDLKEMINLNMNEKIILGFADDSYRLLYRYKIKSFKYICSGVLLINLKNIMEKFLVFIKKNNDSLTQVDQTVINIVLHQQIGFLPPKFGIWNFIDETELLKHNNCSIKEYGITAYDETQILKAFKNPYILHFIHKPWRNQKSYYGNKYNKKFYDIWWYYANKSLSILKKPINI